jgi:hypothetical protein
MSADLFAAPIANATILDLAQLNEQWRSETIELFRNSSNRSQRSYLWNLLGFQRRNPRVHPNDIPAAYACSVASEDQTMAQQAPNHVMVFRGAEGITTNAAVAVSWRLPKD